MQREPAAGWMQQQWVPLGGVSRGREPTLGICLRKETELSAETLLEQKLEKVCLGCGEQVVF